MPIDKYDFYLKTNEFASAMAKKHYPPALDVTPYHQTLKLKIDIPEELVTGSVITKVKANSNGHLQLSLDAIDFDVHDVKSYDEHGNETTITWEYDSEQIHITWETPFKKDETRSIEVKYTVKHPIGGLYFSYPTEDAPNKPVYAASDHETERARYWIPCVDHLSVRCTLDFELTAKEEYTILANGAFISEEKHGNGWKTAKWSLKFPCPSYLLTIAIGKFVEYKDRDADAGYGPIPIAYYTSKLYTPEDLYRSFDKTPQMLEWLTKRLNTPLKFPKYYQYALPNFGGAMENISLVSWDDIFILDGIMAKEFKRETDLVNIHEMTHSFFGDSVVSHDFTHVWLKESWATYMEYVWLDENMSKDEAAYELFSMKESYVRETNRYQRPIVTNKYDSSWDMFDMHLYPGGAWRLHMLRHKLGEQAFWQGVTNYLHEFEGKTVETIDFQRKLEETHGRSLEKYFKQWFYSPGYPKLKIEYSYDKDTHFNSLKITQTQVDEKKGIETFEFPLEIEWELPNGEKQRKTIHVKDEHAGFYFETQEKPAYISIDPDQKTLFTMDFNPGANMLKNALKNGSLSTKIWAARELGKDGKRTNLNAIKQQYEKETYWGIKAEYLKALLTSPNYYGVTLALELLVNENDPMVFRQVHSKLGDITSKDIETYLKTYLETKPVQYIAFRDALIALGKQHNPQLLEYLKAYQPKQDKKQIIIAGKYRAIGAMRTKEALTYLEPLIPKYKTYWQISNALLTAVVDAMKWQDQHIKDKIITQLTNLLKTETTPSFINALINALENTGEEQVIPALQQAKYKIPTIYHSEIDRTIKSLEKDNSQKDTINKLKEDLKKLKDETKKLRDRIELLEEYHKNIHNPK